jgi:xyloglucan-specific exo-beta-1,4-glucanase
LTRNNWGVDALATDPIDTNRLYLAVGMYTIDWDPNNGAILRSTDKGDTWESTALPFKVGGNMPGRGMGEVRVLPWKLAVGALMYLQRLAVDPNDNKILYFGARSGHGLWKSTDYGVTWSNVTSFTWTGMHTVEYCSAWLTGSLGAYVQDSSSAYTADPVGIAWVTFDSTSGSKGSATPRIFVGKSGPWKQRNRANSIRNC